MKTHTSEEHADARKKLPKPIADFLDSQTLMNIYTGLIKKHKLNLREMATVTDIANLTLLGLEPENSMESNIHQELPELSNTATQELVSDINDRVFKEASRRLRENITTPDTWDVAELGPKPTEEEILTETRQRGIEEKDDDDPAVIAADEKEMAAVLKRQEEERAANQKELALLQAQNPVNETPAFETQETPPELPHTPYTINPNVKLAEQGQMAAVRDVREMEEEPTDVHASSTSIHTHKLGGTTVATPQEVEIEILPKPGSSLSGIPVPRIDPYREMPD